MLIEAQGTALQLQDFVLRLRRDAPPRARVDALETQHALPQPGATGFAIHPSRGGAVRTGVVPDTATCGDCLAELFDPADRRRSARSRREAE